MPKEDFIPNVSCPEPFIILRNPRKKSSWFAHGCYIDDPKEKQSMRWPHSAFSTRGGAALCNESAQVAQTWNGLHWDFKISWLSSLEFSRRQDSLTRVEQGNQNIHSDDSDPLQPWFPCSSDLECTREHFAGWWDFGWLENSCCIFLREYRGPFSSYPFFNCVLAQWVRYMRPQACFRHRACSQTIRRARVVGRDVESFRNAVFMLSWYECFEKWDRTTWLTRSMFPGRTEFKIAWRN